jgi:outer membrane immunogenic protein
MSGISPTLLAGTMSIHAVYQIRSGTGIGVFAPQYGSRRGYFIGLKESTDASVSNCRNPTHDERREYCNDDDFASAVTSEPYNRSGLYLGLNAGDAFDGNAATDSGGSVSRSARDSVPGFIGGAQVGANCQTGPVIWGQEANYNASTQNQTLTSGVLSDSNEMPWLATRRGRRGMAFGPCLVYGTAGGIAGQPRPNFPTPAANTIVTHGTRTAGACVEHGLTDHISARLEHLYHDAGSHRFSDDGDQQSAERQSRSSRTEPSLSCRTAGALVNELTYQKGESS